MIFSIFNHVTINNFNKISKINHFNETTILHAAVQSENIEIIKLLLSNPKIDISIKDDIHKLILKSNSEINI